MPLSRHFSNDVINEINSKTDIVSLIQGHVPTLKRKGNKWFGLCPFHSEKTPSFTVDPAKGMYYCFGCHSGGDAIKFVMETQGLSFPDAIKDLARHLGITLEETAPKPKNNQITILEFVKDYFYSNLKTHNQKNIPVEYLKRRGVSGQTAKFFEIGYAPNDVYLHSSLIKKFDLLRIQKAGIFSDKNPKLLRFRDRLIFPIKDEVGNTVGFGGRSLSDGQIPKYLNSPETETFKKNSILYNLNNQKKHDKSGILVVEGYMDVVSLYQHGIKNSVATMGTAISQIHIKKLMQYNNLIYFCFDGDLAGQNASEKALKILMPEYKDGFNFKFVIIPEGYDPDSFIKENGHEEFTRLLTEGYSLGEFIFFYLSNKYKYETIDEKNIFYQKSQELVDLLPNCTLKKLILNRINEFLGLAFFKKKTNIVAKKTVKVPTILEKILAIVKFKNNISQNINFNILENYINNKYNISVENLIQKLDKKNTATWQSAINMFSIKNNTELTFEEFDLLVETLLKRNKIIK